MTGARGEDPRIDAIVQFLDTQYGPAFAGYRLIARRLLTAIDYADELAGICRVELATIEGWMRQLEEGGGTSSV